MFRPLHGLVSVILDPKEKTTKGGIVLPDNFGDIFATGTIQAVGPDALGRQDNGSETDPPSMLTPGMRVIIAQHSHRHPQTGQVIVEPYPVIEDNGVKITVLSHGDIFGIVAD
jgi:co-chaperonin GroES (HSP10)